MKKRNTPAKQMIRELLERAGSAMSQDMLEHTIEGRMDRVTIYRVLNSFCEDGVVHKATSDDGKAYYALCKSCKQERHEHDHAHFRCLGCGKVECLPGNLSVKIPVGYRVENTNYWLSGYCTDCGA